MMIRLGLFVSMTSRANVTALKSVKCSPGDLAVVRFESYPGWQGCQRRYRVDNACLGVR